MRAAGLRARWFIGLCLGVVLAGADPVPARAASLALETVLQMAMNHDPGMRDVRSRIDIGQLKAKQARRKFLPKMDVQTVYGPQLDYFGSPSPTRMCISPAWVWSSPCTPGGP